MMITKLKKVGDEHANNINENEGRHRCNNCYCTGIVPIDESFYEPCFTCGGHGNLTWIDNATKQRRTDINEDTVKSCHFNNIVQSITILKRSLRKLNLGHTVVKIQFDNPKSEKRPVIEDLRELLETYDLL